MLKPITATLWILTFALAADVWAQDAPYKVISVSGGGTISGVVKWSGPVPPVSMMPISKDPEICDPQSRKEVPLDRLIIGPQGGVANTVVFLRDISAGKDFPASQPKPLLDQHYCRYEPHVLLVPLKTDLDIKSSDATLHTVHMEGAASYNLPFPFTNRISSRTMGTAGLVTLKCNGGHVWMNGEIWVIPHPYYVVTNDSGRFELADVPPGEYELVAWHEGWNILHREATFDVLTQRRVERPIFSDPKTWQKRVTVSAGGESTAEFVISGK
jgi:hypothetical protein